MKNAKRRKKERTEIVRYSVYAHSSFGNILASRFGDDP